MELIRKEWSLITELTANQTKLSFTKMAAFRHKYKTRHYLNRNDTVCLSVLNTHL